MDLQGKSGYNVGQTSGDSSYDAYLKMMDEVDAANRSGMTAREFAESKGITSTLTDEEAAALDKYDIRLQSEGSGKTKYDNINIDELSEEAKKVIAEDIRINGGSPIEIPKNAIAKPLPKKAGYQQFSYKWNDGTYKYEARWHTETPGAAKYGRGTTWVVTRTIPGNAKGKMSIIEYKVGDAWIDIEIWKAAERANIAGIATQEQMSILEAGHWLAK